MKIIDAHIHYSNIKVFHETADVLSRVDYTYKGHMDTFKKNNVVVTVAMGLQEIREDHFPDSDCPNPMVCDLDSRQPANMYTCLGINPARLAGDLKSQELHHIESGLKEQHTIGLKIYAGYYHYHIYDDIYQPIYRLAAKYQVPVVIHTGDTYSEQGILKYAHPLNVDELAVANRDVTFVIAHIGDPWVMDCAEVVYKNANVYADLSGLIVGDRQQVERMAGKKHFVDHLKRALVYTDNYKKFIFGSDWPLVDLNAYIAFIKGLIPEAHHEDVFYKTAGKIFNINL